MRSRAIHYSEEFANRFCMLIINGMSITQACRMPGMPNRSTIFRWMESNPEFATKCAHAKELQADYMDDLILETARSATPESAPADRVKLSAYMWRASKLAPKKYGDKIQNEHSGPGGGPIEVSDTLRALTPDKRAQIRAIIEGRDE